MSQKLPVVLAIGGHDPCGGAGIQADIEAIRNNDCYAVSLITTLTAQNTCGVTHCRPNTGADFSVQLQTLTEDIDIQALKVGLINSPEIINILGDWLDSSEKIPVVLDPVLASGSGSDFTNDTIISTMRQRLFPHCTLLTPNSIEARRLTNKEDLETAAEKLLAQGCKWVYLTGTHEDSINVINTLYSFDGSTQQLTCKRLPDEYHGSGCTLAAAIAAKLSHGKTMVEAVTKAQQYTLKCIQSAFHYGKGQHLPDRFSS